MNEFFSFSPGATWDTISRTGSAKCDPKLLSVNQNGRDVISLPTNIYGELNFGGSESCACRKKELMVKIESLLHLSSDICGVELQLNIQYLKHICPDWWSVLSIQAYFLHPIFSDTIWWIWSILVPSCF